MLISVTKDCLSFSIKCSSLIKSLYPKSLVQYSYRPSMRTYIYGIAVFKILIWGLYIVGYLVENLVLRQLLNVISGRVPDDIHDVSLQRKLLTIGNPLYALAAYLLNKDGDNVVEYVASKASTCQLRKTTYQPIKR